MDRIGTIIDLLMLIIGPVALGYAVVSYVRTVRFIRCSTEVAGEVDRLERTWSGDRYGRYDYAPVFSFTALDGKTHTVTSDVSSSPPDFSVGQQVRVRYDPEKPENARIHTFFQTWGGAVICLAVGVAFLGVALYQFGYLHSMHLLSHEWSSR